jgi:hypothetical protein
MTSRQLLIHIGTGKTGTTSIQEALHRAAADRTLGDISYWSPGGPDHNFIAAMYMARDRLPREYRTRYHELGNEALARDAASFRDRLFDSIRQSQKTILSAEYLGRFGPDELHALRTDLTQLGVDEIRVVAYVRDPASAYLSVVQQKLKAASIFKSPALYRYPFRQTLQTWNKEFPDLAVRPFVSEQLVGGDVVRDFDDVASSFFGLTGGLNLPATAQNQSVSAEGMIVLQRYRQAFHSAAEDQFKWDSEQLVQILQQSLNTISQTRPALVPSAEEVVMRHHQDDLEWLWRVYGVDLGGSSTERQAEGQAVSDPYEGSRYMKDVTLILESYDQGIVDELLFHCVRRALKKQRSSSSQLSKMSETVSELKGQLKGSRRDAVRARRRLQHVLASRSWRWGRRIALILSGPRWLARAFRRSDASIGLNQSGELD